MQGAETDERLPNKQSQNQGSTNDKIVWAHSSYKGPTRINADNQKKFNVLCYSLTFIAALVFLSLISALVLPNALISVNEEQWIDGNSLQNCNTHLYLVNRTIQCFFSGGSYSTVGAYVSNLDVLNQFLVLYLQINDGEKNLNLNEYVLFSLYSAKQDTPASPILVVDQIASKNISLSGKARDIFDHGRLFILYMSKLNSEEQFYWQLQFQNNSQLSPSPSSLESQVVNPQFSLFAIFLRVSLFLLSLGVFLKFNHIIFNMPTGSVSIEQRSIQVLSAMNLLFNDQLYFITVISPNPVSSFLSSFFLWNFVTYLFIIWSLFLNRIRNEEPETTTKHFTLPRGIIMSIFYTLVLGYSVAYAVTQTSDHPIFSYEDIRSGVIIGLEVVAFVAYSLACTYIIYLYICILKEKPNRLYRHNLFMIFTAVFFISTTVFFFLGGYDLYNYSASKIFFTFAFMNMYSFYLQYLYAPSPEQIKMFRREKRQSKPLMEADELLEIPESGEVEVVLIQSQEQNNSSESKEEGSLSARQRRKRNRKKRGLNKSGEVLQKGQTKQRIINDQQVKEGDQFS